MRFLVLRSYAKLIYFNIYFLRNDFSSLYERVRNYPLGKSASDPNRVQRVCDAVDMACIWYPKEVLCLQRSAATTCMLRDVGVEAKLVIGSQVMPHKTHAWVEVEGQVVNDKAYTPEIYTVMDRC